MPDLRGVTTHGATGLVEHRGELFDPVGIAAGDVPYIAMSCHETKGGGARGADPDRWMRLLKRLGVGDRVGHPVVATVEVGAVLGPERLDDLQRLAEPADAMVEALDAIHLVLDLRPCRADSELEPPAGEMIDGDGGLGEQRGVSVRVAGDKAADPHAFGGYR